MELLGENISTLLGTKKAEDIFFKVYPEYIEVVSEVRMDKVRCPSCKMDSLDAWIYKYGTDWLQENVDSICLGCQQHQHSKQITNRMKTKRQGVIDDHWYFINEFDESGFKNFETSNDSTKVAKTKAEEYARAIRDNEIRNLRITGTTGTGKTHLAIAIARTAKHEGKSVAFITAMKLFDKIKGAFNDEHAQKRFEKQLSEFDIVVIDDVGVETKKKADISWSSSEWVRLVELRKGKSTVYTTNFDPKTLAGVIGARAESRMSEHSMMIEIFTPDEDYRKDKLFY